MHFSSMAVSVLAQSVPLLAVGHLADWKKREERSWLQSRRLRDSLLMGVHDRKGVLFEKHVGVNRKHDEALKTKRSESARLVQGSASSKASVECDPLSKVNDSGIFICGTDSHCVESEESELGGFCITSKEAPSIHRGLQTYDKCQEAPYGEESPCDCSQFNETSGLGNLTCTGKVCGATSCRTSTVTESIYADGSYIEEDCYEFSGGMAIGLESVCYSFSYSSDLNSTACEIKANGVVCNSCELNQEGCPANTDYRLTSVFDCTNTDVGVQGSRCYVDAIYSLLKTTMPTTAPTTGSTTASTTAPMTASTTAPVTASTTAPTTAPTTGPPETLDPPPETGAPGPISDEMPSGTTSSGCSHTVKVPIVVSAAAVAWMASFGT